MRDSVVQYRHEFKYIISDVQMEILKKRIDGLIPLDPNCLQTGSYVISSLYLDNYANSCYYENENGIDPREKYRIRTYNHNPDLLKLECKRKECEKTLKTSSNITSKEMSALFTSRYEDFGISKNVVKNKLFKDVLIRMFHPVVIVEYERIPYIYKNGNVRVTFDMNITSSDNVSRFLEFDYPRRPIMPVGFHLLEVKYDAYCPDFTIG